MAGGSAGAGVSAVKTPKPPRTPEAAVLRACLRYLSVAGIEAWRNNSGLAMLPGRGGKPQPVRFGKKGAPDICGYMPDGRALYVECKASDGKLRPEQAEFLSRAQKAGCVCIVARSLDDLEAGLLGARHVHPDKPFTRDEQALKLNTPSWRKGAA